MKRFAKLAAAAAALPVLALAPVAYGQGVGQIEQGNIYYVRNLTSGGSFANDISGAACGDTVQFRVVVHNGGPETLTNVKVAATLNSALSTSHGSQASVSADNNLHNAVVTANAGVNTTQNTTADYVSGSTQLVNLGGSVLKNLPDGILGGGVNIGSIGPLTSDTESVQFQAKINCPAPVVKFACTALDVKQIDRTHFDFTASASVQNATVSSYKFTTTNSSGTAVDTTTHNTSALSDVYHFNQETGKYTVSAVVNTDHGSTNAADCSKQIEVAAATTTTTPQVGKTLPNTGPGEVAGLFAGSSALGAAGHYIVRRRR